MAKGKKKRSIFQKEKLKPQQLRTAARRRYGDAVYLRNSNVNERANGAVYLAGFAIECLLKAELLKTYKWLGGARSPGGRTKEEQRIWALCYRKHALDEILTRLPHIEKRLQAVSKTTLRSLKKICGEWTIYARYSPHATTQGEAADFLQQVEELQKWLED